MPYDSVNICKHRPLPHLVHPPLCPAFLCQSPPLEPITNMVFSNLLLAGRNLTRRLWSKASSLCRHAAFGFNWFAHNFSDLVKKALKFFLRPGKVQPLVSLRIASRRILIENRSHWRCRFRCCSGSPVGSWFWNCWNRCVFIPLSLFLR